jgi:hypothetical protein
VQNVFAVERRSIHPLHLRSNVPSAIDIGIIVCIPFIATTVSEITLGCRMSHTTYLGQRQLDIFFLVTACIVTIPSGTYCAGQGIYSK